MRHLSGFKRIFSYRVVAPLMWLPLIGFLGVLIALGILAFAATGMPYRAVAVALVFAGIALLFFCAHRVRWQVLGPLVALRRWVQDIDSGNWHARIPVPIGGEWDALASTINLLGDTVQDLAQRLASQQVMQNERAAQKTRSLEVLYDVAASINVSRDLDDLLGRFLKHMQEVVNARAASVRLLDDDGHMRLVASVGFDPELVEKYRLIPMEHCLNEAALATGEILFQDDLSACSQFIQLVPKLENMEMITVPLQYRSNTLGVYNLFTEKPGMFARQDVKDLLTSVGRHLGMAIEKSRMDDEAKQMSIMHERTHIAHELHDSLAQTLASLRFQVRVLDETLQQSGGYTGIAELEQVEQSLEQANSELRELIAHFRAPVAEHGLLPAVEKLISRFRSQTGVSVLLQNSEWRRDGLPPEMEMHVLRIIQESLTNIRKHSEAHVVRILMRSQRDGEHQVLIEDDGIGVGDVPKEARPGERIGLSIMRERAEQLGGELHIESDPGEGTRILLLFHTPAYGSVKPFLPHTDTVVSARQRQA